MSKATKTTKKSNSKYIPKGKKPYQLWIEEHKEELFKIPQKDRVDYVYQKMNEELKSNMSLKSVYQLLYRNNLIEHKKASTVIKTKAEQNKEDIEIINPESVIDSLIVNNTDDKINEYNKYDIPEFIDKNMSSETKTKAIVDHMSPAVQFITEHLIHYLGQSSLIMCCLVPNMENIDEEYKPIVNKFIDTLLSLNSEIDNLKELSQQMKNVDLSRCEEVVVKFLKNNQIDMKLSKYDNLEIK